ncbi:hypothetical protein [uncultured Flavobacterium sp.]|uniref:hypothetical protein n=1 Tax=uncultured Flavobacterium sp. TaxID=165435 RepID=UPI0025D3E2D0|nr:hypothetical protein [uncultured Flavobacterium sp.]
MENKNERIAKIEAFFDAYAKRFRDGIDGKAPDVEGTVGAFTGSFIESSPLGVIAKENDEKFKEMVPQGYAYYMSIGSSGMEIRSRVITLLDNLHSMAQISWKADYIKKDGKGVSIEFDVFYMVTEKDGAPRIFAYITGDEQKALDDNGLVPYK